MTYVYKITRIDGLEYIGITNRLNARINEHSKSSRFSLGVSKFEVLDECSTYKEAELKEEYYIEKYNTHKHGLNLTSDGKGLNGKCDFNTLGFKFSSDSRAKMSVSAKARGVPCGRVVSKETREKMSKVRKGKSFYLKISFETKKQIINAYVSRDTSFITVELLKSVVSVRNIQNVTIDNYENFKFKSGHDITYRSLFVQHWAKQINCSKTMIRNIINGKFLDETS